jgi:hypothetical protein
LAEFPKSQIERLASTEIANTLAMQYILKGVVSEKKLNDCKHVALATLHADGIVSWNLKHMVKREKLYNNVNAAEGYRVTKIVTPNKYKEIYHEK